MKYYGQFNPPLDEYLHKHFFIDKKNGISLEAGASNGVLENNTKFFEEFLNWKTINVEPLSEWFNELIINRPNSININKALHPYSNDKIVEFNIPILDEYKDKNHLGSLNLNNVTKYNKEIKTINVETITFNKIIKDTNINELDLFILDIEGYEEEFLKSFNEWILYPKVFVIEVGHINSNIIDNIIKSKYKLYDTLFVNNIYILK
jgi:FkbM family methyltransferase